MKLTKMTFTLVLILAGILASGPVLARGHGRVHFGVFVGGPVFWPGYYYPPPYYYPPYYPAYYPPVITVPASPPTYIEQGGAQTAPAPSSQTNWWYYCADAKAYYPYVKDCPAGWQRVSPQPPS